MLIRHLMTREVRALSPDTSCREALRVFQRQRIRHAPVLEEDRLVGVVSERDLLRQLPSSVMQLEGQQGWDAEHARVRKAMTRNPLTCSPNDPIDVVARSMLERKVSCLPVIEGGKLVGIVTSSDLFRGFASITSSGDGSRISLMSPRRAGSAGFDPAAACVRLGLRLKSLISHDLENGAELFLVHLLGGAADADRFLRAATKAGCLLLTPVRTETRAAG